MVDKVKFALAAMLLAVGMLCTVRYSRGDSGLVVDAYTQKVPFNGEGMNQPSDPFSPDEKVIVYAKVTYNEGPCINQLVSFAVLPPNNSFPFMLSDFTNESGIAACTFRVPSIYMGEWIVNVTANIGEIFAYDILKFNVTWIVNVKRIEILDENFVPKNLFSHGERVNIKLHLRNEALSPKDVIVAITIFDSAETCIISIESSERILHGDNMIFIDGKEIPLFASSGNATLIVNLYDRPLEEGGQLFCPEASESFSIGIVNVAIVGFEASSTQVRKGELVKLTITAKNEGEFTQTFNLQVFANGSLIKELTVENLEAGAQRVVSLTLNTSDMSAGNYTIKAYIPPVPGEKDVSDNEKEVSISIIVSPPTSAWNLFIILLIIIILLLLILSIFALRRRKKEKAEKGRLAALIKLFLVRPPGFRPLVLVPSPCFLGLFFM